jgi:DNA-binding transcriptional regulator YdaS (Cro superfamily)
MRLLDYLNKLPIEQREELATRCGTSFDYLRQIAYGNRACKEALAIKLEKFTNRELMCEDLCPDVDWAFLRQGGRNRESDGEDAAGE